MRRTSVDELPIVPSSKSVFRSAMAPFQFGHHEPEEHNKLNSILRLLFPCYVHVQRTRTLNGHLHSLRLLTLSNGVQLLLKSSPSRTTALLRRDRFLLETEARALALLGQSANPCVPQLFHYHPQGTSLEPPFLVRQYLMGSTLQSMEARLTAENRTDIDRHLGFLIHVIGQHVAPGFGPLEQVASGRGRRSWWEAFVDLFEAVLRDAEDMFIHLPYAEIRHEVTRLSHSLGDVAIPRLVVVDMGDPSQVLLDPESQQVSGIVDFSSALWGDVLMAEVFDNPSPALLDGFGSGLVKSKSGKFRSLLWVTQIFSQGEMTDISQIRLLPLGL